MNDHYSSPSDPESVKLECWPVKISSVDVKARELKQTAVTETSRTIAIHVYYKSLYISLMSAKQ